MRSREVILSDLAKLNGPLEVLRTELQAFDWDCETPYYAATQSDIDGVLRRASSGSLSAQDIEDWANAVEFRDDLDFENEEVRELVHELANPLLFGRAA